MQEAGGEEDGVEQDDGGSGGEVEDEGEGDARQHAGGGDAGGDPQGGPEAARQLQGRGGGEHQQAGDQQRAHHAHAQHDKQRHQDGRQAREAFGAHAGHAGLVGIEREKKDNWLDGVAFFQNSFNQPVVYLFPFGKAYHDIWGIEKLTFKWTAGLLYGYLGEYSKRVPLNYNGFSPAVNVALAYQFTPVWGGQILLGGSFLMFMINMRIP